MSDQNKQKAHIQFALNGEPAEVAFAPHKTLLEVLREDLRVDGDQAWVRAWRVWHLHGAG